MSNSETFAADRDWPDGEILSFAQGQESRTNRFRVLIVGDTTSAEMSPLVVRLLHIVTVAARVVVVGSCSDITASFSVDEFPDLIIVLQSWSDEYSASDVNQLLAFAPLARIVVCYGLWCESDGRNRAIWPLASRVPTRSAESRVQREWSAICADNARKMLPLSASRDEVFAADHSHVDRTATPLSYLIDTPDPAMAEFVRERLQAEGHRVSRDSPLIVIIDVDPWDDLRASQIQQRCSQFPAAELQALTSWPTPQLLAELAQAGVTKVIHKLSLETQRLVPQRNRCETPQGTGSEGACALA